MAVETIADILTSQMKSVRKYEAKRKRRRKRRLASSTEQCAVNGHQLSNMNSQTKTEPDPDAIKMFVGQIPRSWDENDLRKLFEDFGPIYQLNVLRDKVTNQSKGCCFVTFYTRKDALEAQNQLHNIKTLMGMQHPIQMKPADSEKRNEERKLFVGMLSKKCTENDIRMMFSPFGQIEECTVLREQNGQSKGCAFVTYASKQCTQNAIKAMHHSQTMEGCRSPLVVKYADTPKEKELKKLQQANANLLSSMANNPGLNSLAPQYLALLQQAAAAGNLGALNNLLGSSNLGTSSESLLSGGLNVLQMQQLLTAAATAAAALQNNPGEASNMQHLQNLQGLAALASVANQPELQANQYSLNTLGVQNLAALNQLAAVTNPSPMSSIPGLNSSLSGSSSQSSSASVATTNTTNTMGAMGGLATNPNSLPNMAAAAAAAPSNLNGISTPTSNLQNSQSGVDALSQAYTGIQQYAASFPNAFTTQTAAQIQQAAANSPAGKVTEGPDGGNLFIYHLPQEFSDHDLYQTFMPFGNVISSKVFIDKQTNLSKCFGFVSYDNPMSGQAAIQAMNGFQIGMKRLKVQLKRPKSESKPY